jgi:hypothetical protein
MAVDHMWSQFAVASFEVDGEIALLPLAREYEYDEGLRVAGRAVPFVDGEQLDETGLDGEAITLNLQFFNDVDAFVRLGGDSELDREGMEILYPARLERLIGMFRRKKTGTLHVMNRRNIRCKATRWRRSGKVEERDGEWLVVTFKVDNEAKLEGPSSDTIAVKANLQRTIEEAVFEAERAGTGGGWDWSNLRTFAAQLDAAMSAPSEFLDDLRQKAHVLGSACDRILESYQRNVAGHDTFLDPAAEPAVRALEKVRDMAYSAEAEVRERRPPVKTKRFREDLTMWEIAEQEGQDAGRILYLNSQIEDPNWVRAGTPVLLEVL